MLIPITLQIHTQGEFCHLRCPFLYKGLYLCTAFNRYLGLTIGIKGSDQGWVRCPECLTHEKLATKPEGTEND